MALVMSTQYKKLAPNVLGSTYRNLKSSKPQEMLLCKYYGFSKVNSEQETCQKYFVVHISKFEINQTTIIYPTRRISWL